MSERKDEAPSAPAPPSKSELKRQALARDRLVEELLALSDGILRKIDLTAATLEDLARIRPMRPSKARNRAIKHLAARILDSERDSAHRHLNDRKSIHAEENRRLHLMEHWRERLIEEGDGALSELCLAYPELDRQHLRTLARAAQKEQLGGKPSGAARKLFQELRQLMTRGLVN